MTDDNQAQAGGTGGDNAAQGITVPDDVRKQFPELIDLVLGSESMNDEERQYWINILPIMTPDQIQNLRDILMNEKRQLAAIDEKYSQDMHGIGQKQLIERTDEERKKRRQEREQAEQASTEEEEEAANALLKEIGEI